jgi:PAS domain S-box-containing protein
MRVIGRFERWMKSSIRRRLVILATVFWIASTSVLSLILIFAGRGTMTEEANQRNDQLASVVSREINAEISTISANARTFAAYLEQISPELPSQAQAFLALRLTSPQRYRAAYYFDSQADPLIRLDDPLDALLSLSVSDITSRPSAPTDPEVLAALQKVEGNIYLSSVTFDAIDRSPLMFIGIPVKLADAGDRVVVLEVDVSDIWQRIDLMTVGQSGIAYLVSPSGTIIAHPNRAYVGQPMPVELKRFLGGNEGHTEYVEPFRKEQVLASISPVGGQTGWATVVQQDKSEAYTAVSRTVATSVGVWSLLSAVGVVGILISVRNFARPIVSLTKTAQYIARTGELARTAMSQNPDEVGQLSQAFDGMIGKLESAEQKLLEAHQELENRVTVRTAQLTETNTLLKSEIEQRKQVELALRESELKYRHVVQGTTAIILEMDLEGRVAFFNQYAEEFFGFTESEIMGKSVVGTVVPPQDSAGRDLEAMISDIVKNPERYRRNENENVRKNGERVWIVWSNQPLSDEEGRPRGILCVGMDMTEQKKAEALLDAQTREQAATAERTRLARDLHDAVSQTLFSASLIAEVLPRIWEKDPEQGRDRLEEIRQLTRGALAEMRTLLFELRPAALVDVELPDLLKQLAESVTGRARVPVTTHFEGQCRIPPDAKIALYRIAQEALNNIAKHSGADNGMVILKSEPGKVELRVKDNGTGFDRSKVTGRSLGLGIMEERARAIGASLDVHSEVGHGTEVTAIWQISTEEEQP